LLTLAVDPGKHGAAAWWIGDRFINARLVENTKEAVTGVLQWAQAEAKGHGKGGLVLLIERQFQHMGKRANVSTTEALMRSRFLWEILGEVLDIPTVLVWPATWQTQLTLAPAQDDKGRKMSTKAKSIWVASRYILDRKWTDGEADAALIGRWHVRKNATV
jgi:hypothetical protein